MKTKKRWEKRKRGIPLVWRSSITWKEWKRKAFLNWLRTPFTLRTLRMEFLSTPGGLIYSETWRWWRMRLWSMLIRRLISLMRCSRDKLSSRQRLWKRLREIGPMRSSRQCTVIIWLGLLTLRQGLEGDQRRLTLKMEEADLEEERLD